MKSMTERSSSISRSGCITTAVALWVIGALR
jgi:hypothetical protein